MPKVKDAAIWTIGHSTREFAEFLELLAISDIECVVDVRRYPGSRKYPHFNEQELGRSLAEHGINYNLAPQLGGRRRPRPGSRNTVWRNESCRGYADYMETSEFKDAAAQLIESARLERTAIMCSEAVWWRCHRALIADYLKTAGVTVEHILGAKANQVHPFTAAARHADGELFYGPAH